MTTKPNKPDAPNPARVSRLTIGCHWRGVSDPFRWASFGVMRVTCFTFLIAVALPAICVAGDKQAAVWTEKCTNCGTGFHISRSFDQSDYTFIGQFIDQLPSGVTSIFYRSPHGPQPACSATWSKDMSYELLRKQTASLRKDTYDSFIARNRYIAEHATNSFTTPAGRKVRIIGETKADTWLLTLTRVGLSGDGRQALICTDSIVYLYEQSGSRWKQVGKVVLWIP